MQNNAFGQESTSQFPNFSNRIASTSTDGNQNASVFSGNVNTNQSSLIPNISQGIFSNEQHPNPFSIPQSSMENRKFRRVVGGKQKERINGNRL